MAPTVQLNGECYSDPLDMLVAVGSLKSMCPPDSREKMQLILNVFNPEAIVSSETLKDAVEQDLTNLEQSLPETPYIMNGSLSMAELLVFSFFDFQDSVLLEKLKSYPKIYRILGNVRSNTRICIYYSKR